MLRSAAAALLVLSCLPAALAAAQSGPDAGAGIIAPTDAVPAAAPAAPAPQEAPAPDAAPPADAQVTTTTTTTTTTTAPPPADAPAQFTQTATLDHPATDELVWNISAGGTLNTGNTQSFSGNAGTHFSIRRGPHAFLFDFQAIEGLSHVPFRDPLDWKETASSLNATARYDYFFTPMDAMFVATTNRHDQFAGLDYRFQAQVGYLRTLFQEEKHKLWAEVGYDFTYDIFYYAPSTTVGPSDRTIHSARLYLGYDNHINDYLTFTTGLEALFRPYAVMDQGDFQLRLTSISELHVKIDTHFALGLTFTARYDSQPALGKTNLDTVTVLSLLYTLI